MNRETFDYARTPSILHMECCACEECVFEPYLRGNKAEKFACLSKVFDTSSVARILKDEIEPSQRQAFVDSLCFEAEARLRDPVLGCVGIIRRLEHQLQELKLRLEISKEELKYYHNLMAHHHPTRRSCL